MVMVYSPVSTFIYISGQLKLSLSYGVNTACNANKLLFKPEIYTANILIPVNNILFVSALRRNSQKYQIIKHTMKENKKNQFLKTIEIY